MAESEAGPLLIGLPERLDRRMRLGPFPSSRDALKFVTYAAAGALLSPITSPWLWLPIVLVGFTVSVWRPDGQALDERLLVLARWKLRSVNRIASMKKTGSHPLVREGLLEISPHRYVAVIRTGGAPIAYLPPDQLLRRFQLFRDAIRSTNDSFVMLSMAVPIRSEAVRPSTDLGAGPEERACSGYSELATLLCRRRLLRRVYVVLGTLQGTPDSITGLEGRVGSLMERLNSLDLRPIRLRDQGLAEAARQFGWPVGVSHP
jgi:hypothetical protein